MGKINFEDNIFSYCEREFKEEILNLNRPIDNHGRIPFSEIEGKDSVSSLIERMISLNSQFDDGMQYQPYDFLMINLLCIKKWIATSALQTVVVMAPTGGRVEYQLLNMLSCFNPKASLFTIEVEDLKDINENFVDLMIVDARNSEYQYEEIRDSIFRIMKTSGEVIWYSNKGNPMDTAVNTYSLYPNTVISRQKIRKPGMDYSNCSEEQLSELIAETLRNGNAEEKANLVKERAERRKRRFGIDTLSDSVLCSYNMERYSGTVSIYFNDETTTCGDGTRPEDGNSGMGGSQYENLLLIRFLSKLNTDCRVDVYHSNSLNRFPEGVNNILVSNIAEAVNKHNEGTADSFLFTFSPTDMDKLNNCICRNAICWLTVPLSFFDKKYTQELTENYNIKQVVCVSRSMYESYRGQPIFRKMTYIDNMWCMPEDSLRIYENRSHCVTYLGGVYPQKGFHILAKAWRKVLSEIPDAELNVIGSGTLYAKDAIMGKRGIACQEYEDLFLPYLTDAKGELLKSVHFHGLLGREKNGILINTAVGVVNPSGITETFCISAVEFESLGVPVISKMNIGLVDTVVSGKTGLLTKNADAEELADAIIKILSDDEKRKHYGENAVDYVKKHFEPQVIIPKWNSLLNSVNKDEV